MPKVQIIDTNRGNIQNYGFCGYKNVKNEGHIRKSEWLKKRYDEGLKFKVLHSDLDGSVGIIEYIPGEYCWRAVKANGYMFIHCIMIYSKKYKGKGYGAELLKHCISDARKAKMLGVAVMTSAGTWMADKNLFLANGFEMVDSAPPRFDLLALKFKKTAPSPGFNRTGDKLPKKYKDGLTIFWSDQCPYNRKSVNDVTEAAESLGIVSKLVEIDDCKTAQILINPYGTYCMIYNGESIADHPVSRARFLNIMKEI
ncbi:MAG: GNAT family N-acetyltransferase [Candidatus Zixiibacteriota bacterium]|nr:MAG: GNAT family N-acetyltransferase [candidate division Zixibacteria bacterium]